MKTLFNIFWVILVGLASAIINALTGIALCCTIIGIPFGIQYFKFIPLAFAPAGKVVVTRYSKHPIMNTLWLIFGGLWVYIVYWLLTIVFCITIIGIPIGLQLYKIAAFNFAPFGAEVLHDGEYSSYGDTRYDFNLLFSRIHANPDKTVSIFDYEGHPMTARTYFGEKYEEYVAFKTIEKKRLKRLMLEPIITYGTIVAILFIYSILQVYTEATDTAVVSMVVSIFILGNITFYSIRAFLETLEYRQYIKLFKELEIYYPNGSPQTKVSIWKKPIGADDCYIIMGYTLPYKGQ